MDFWLLRPSLATWSDPTSLIVAYGDLHYSSTILRSGRLCIRIELLEEAT